MQKTIEVDHFYLSAHEYSKQTGLGYQDTLDQCEKGLFDCYLTEGGQWRIRVYKNSSVSRKEVERLKEENTKLKTTLRNLQQLLNTAL